ncbi:hypothetical protein J4410_02575 [Candidatus Woesearchaeota archaeon]|nr:hypothetical protein [Candidatus Woesearchaeota archaeon]
MKKFLGLLLILALLLPSVLSVVFEQYPVTLAKSGRFNTLIIIGENAAIRDSLAAVELSEVLQNYFDTIAKEAKEKLEKELDRFQKEDIYAFDELQIDECLGDDTQVVTSGSLSTLLQGGTIQTRDRTTYEQYLRFGDADDTELGCVKVVFDRNDEDDLDTFLFVEDGTILFEYELSFGSGLGSRLEGSTLRDLIDEQIVILGRPYRIIDAITSGNSVDLKLMQGEMQDTLQEGMTKTYTIGGVPYHVNVLIVSDNANGGAGGVKFRVNGQTTSLLADGETETLSDGTIIGVRNVIPNEAGETSGGGGETYDASQYEDIDYGQYAGLSPAELEAVLGEQYTIQDQVYAGGGDVVEFFIGAHVLRFEDHANDDRFEQGVSVNFDSVKNGFVQIKGDQVDNEYKIYSIKYRLEAESADGDDIYIPKTKGMREFLNSPGDLLSPVWDIRFGGVNNASSSDQQGSTITFRPKSSDQGYDFLFTNNRGGEYRVPFVNNEGSFKLGDQDEDFFFIECSSASDFCIPQGSSIVLTDRNSHSGVTQIVQYTDINTGERSVTFQDLDGSQQTKTYSGTLGSDAFADLVFGGNSYKVFIGDDTDNYAVAIDMNKDGDVGSDEVKVVVRGGGILDLGSTNTPSGDFDVTLTTEASEIEDSSSDEVITWRIEDRGSGKLGITLADQTDLTLESEDGHKKGITNFGVRFDLDDTTVGEKLTINYPGGESNVEVTILASETLAPADTSAEGLFSFEGIKVGTFHLDSEIEDIYKENMLVVGGPCANEVSKELLGNYDPCTAGFEEGKAILRIFNLQESFSILAAGYTAEDTQKAVHVLKNFKDYPFLTDTFVEISGPLDDLKFRQLTPQEWQSRVDFARIESREEKVEETNITEPLEEIPEVPVEEVEEQGTLEEMGVTEEKDLSLQTNQNIMLIVGIFIFVAVILLISYMSYKHHKQEEQEEEQHHPRKAVVAMKRKHVEEEEPEEDAEDEEEDAEQEEEEDELEEGRKAAAVPQAKSRKEIKEEKKRRKREEKQRKKAEKTILKEEKRKEKEEKKKRKSGEPLKKEKEDVDLDSLEKGLLEGLEKHKKSR